MKFYYFLLPAFVLVILPLLRVLAYWYSNVFLFSVFFIIAILIANEILFLEDNIKILYALLLGFSFGLIITTSETYFERYLTFMPLVFDIIIHLPKFMEKILSIPKTVVILKPLTGIIGSMISLVIMLLIRFLRKRLAYKRNLKME